MTAARDAGRGRPGTGTVRAAAHGHEPEKHEEGGGEATDAVAGDLLAPALLDVVRQIPNARVGRSAQPRDEARRLARRAAAKAALAAGALALPTGPLGWLTLLPELRSVWRVQVQLVADVAALYGRKSHLTKEQVLYCLFSHGSARRAFQDLVVRVGGRFFARPATAQALRFVARQVAVRVAQRMVGQGAARWLPVAGAVGIGAYAWHETTRVANNAIELFEAGVLPAPPDEETTAGAEAGAVAPRVPRLRAR